MTTRPLVTVYNGLTGEATGKQMPLPCVMQAPIRSDVVHKVFTDMSKNRRQANGVQERAGHMTSAESWGTGRAVARIPRVAGGGTHRSGQGAFGNMCRGGHMFSPKVTWRRWHRRININMKRYAVASAIAASAVPALVMARGHRVQQLREVPLVLAADTLATVDKTKKAVEVLKKVGAYEDVQRVMDSVKLRAGRGKMRNRRYVRRLGPLIVYKQAGKVVKAFRNIPGVDLCRVDRLNLLQLAPGSHMGRFVIWTSDAFAELRKLFGTFRAGSAKKTGFVLPRAKMSNPDLNRLINCEAVQSALRPARRHALFSKRKRNPLRNWGAMVKLNPFAAVLRRKTLIAQSKALAEKKRGAPDAKKPKKEAAPKKEEKKKTLPKNVAFNKANKAARKAFVKSLFA